MPGVVFIITVPTASHENVLRLGNRAVGNAAAPTEPVRNSVNVEVELRNKYNLPPNKRRMIPNDPKGAAAITAPMEKIVEDLLKKLQIERVVWTLDKTSTFYQVIFPIDSGDPCETTLHCLTKLGIGVKLQSNLSIIPCSVTYDGQNDDQKVEEEWTMEQQSKWDMFVDSIRSKLTVKQVVDGVRSGGSLSFDYLLLIVTADSLAALGLVENNAPNIVAAMLVSPLMGPVMSITFGAIISDCELVKSGFIAFSVGLLVSLAFGFIFGLILGTTAMPWGFGDWPTEEMKGRGNYRSLWMGVLWALTSGTGVAVALLVGSVGPLIGVAISASLLPPLVNCGLFWALACIWLIYDDIKIPHIKGEPYTGNSTYQFIYTDYIPTEFFINGIVSGLLTIVNVICIFITAIIVLKIKEVASPYTSSPDLRRFWEKDIQQARRTNRSTIRKGPHGPKSEKMGTGDSNTFKAMFEKAVQEATDNNTFRTVKRMSYANSAADGPNLNFQNGRQNHAGADSSKPVQLPSDVETIDKLVTTLIRKLETAQQGTDPPPASRPKSFRFRQSVKQRDGGGGSGTGGVMETTFMENGQMPTIAEQSPNTDSSVMRNAFHTIAETSHRLSHSILPKGPETEETANLTDWPEGNKE